MLPRIARTSAIVLAFVAALLIGRPDRVAAAEATYPKGSSIGLVPPSGFEPAAGFSGFEDKAHKASIVIVEMPVEAYGQIVSQMTPDALKATGMVAQGDPGDWPLAGAQARILRGRQMAGGLTFAKWVVIAGAPTATAMVTAQIPEESRAAVPDAAIEAALRSIVFRAPESLDDQIAALPFAIGDRAGLRVVRTMAGSGLYLTEGPHDTVKDASQPIVIVASNLGQAPPPAARAAFARKAIAGVKQIADLKIASETNDATGPVEWARIEGTGTDATTGTPIRVVQVVRFEGLGYVRVIGLAREPSSDIAERTRRLAGSITLR